MALNSLNSIEGFDEIGTIDKIVAIMMLFITIGAPLWATYFMRMFKKYLNDEDFKKKFEVLYQK